MEAWRTTMLGVRTCGEGAANTCGDGAVAGLFRGVLLSLAVLLPLLGDMKILSMRRLKPRFCRACE